LGLTAMKCVWLARKLKTNAENENQ
jgi:hypothetical protein